MPSFDLFRPMLADDADLTKLRFPLLASAKLDGIRAIVKNGVVLSRSLKPIPSTYVQSLFKHLEHFDGELVVGPPVAKDCYRQTTSHVMAHNKTDFDVKFYAFDHIADLSAPYRARKILLDVSNKESKNKKVVVHAQHHVACLETLLNLEEKMLDQGYEGLILRDADARYKCGRSTVNEGFLLKLKRFEDDEATVTGFEERMHNGNVATTNELGRTSRSSHAARKVGRGDLGALVVVRNGTTFNIGTGFSDDERADIWANRTQYLGKEVKFKHFAVGAKDAPRHPVFLGWRDKADT